jgi:hypothetical protein
MAIVVEDGTGLPTANAYVSVTEADTILAINIHSTWATLTTPVKEKLIQWATRILNERARWKGARVSQTSGTPFPRTGLRDDDGIYYAINSIPMPVKVATAVLADFLGTGDPTAPNSSANLKRLDVDVISLQFDLGIAPERWPSSVAITLRNIANISFSSKGGKRIVKH